MKKIKLEVFLIAVSSFDFKSARHLPQWFNEIPFIFRSDFNFVYTFMEFYNEREPITVVFQTDIFVLSAKQNGEQKLCEHSQATVEV